MKKAAFLVLPSVNYEGFPRTVVESYARGLPVLASRLGSLAELVREGETGALFAHDNPADLAASAEALFQDREALRRQRALARETYDRDYRGAVNFKLLEKVYQSALAERAKSQPAGRLQTHVSY